MRNFISILSGVVTGLIIGLFLWRKKNSSLNADKNNNDELQGIVKDRSDQMEKNLAKALEFIVDKKKITNDELQSYLNISNATAARYLEELEKRGRLKQIGETGKYTYYQVL